MILFARVKSIISKKEKKKQLYKNKVMYKNEIKY